MTELAKQKVTFGDITAADGKEITPVITVTCQEWPGENLQAQADGSYALPAGTYNYVISCSGYKSVKGQLYRRESGSTDPGIYPGGADCMGRRELYGAAEE